MSRYIPVDLTGYDFKFGIKVRFADEGLGPACEFKYERPTRRLEA